MEGFIKLHRGLMKWEWFDDSKTLHLFLTILLNVNHKDGRWRGHEVKRGQWITGRKALSKMTKISERSIRTILQRLVETGELTIQTTNRFSVITVVKWDSYQLQDNTTDQQNANKRPATDQLPTTNKNVKNEKNVNKKTYSELNNVLLTDNEYKKLQEKFNGSLDSHIENLSLYIASKGKKYKSHYATILAWSRKNNNNNDDNSPRGKKL